MLQLLHERLSRLDVWDIVMVSLAAMSLAAIVIRTVPELLDVSRWWWGSLAILLVARPLYRLK